MQKLFSEYLKMGLIPSSWTEVRTIILQKPDRDLSSLEAYHPISLLNVYKILATILPARLNQVISCYIHSDQSVFLRNTHSGDIVRMVMNIMSNFHTQKSPSLLYFMDAEKAFDWLEWVFLKGILPQMNFGPKFCLWFCLIRSDQKSSDCTGWV